VKILRHHQPKITSWKKKRQKILKEILVYRYRITGSVAGRRILVGDEAADGSFGAPWQEFSKAKSGSVTIGKDVQGGGEETYFENGFECELRSCLWPKFYIKIKKYYWAAWAVTCSNDIGTQLGYSVFFNKPHILYNKLSAGVKRPRSTWSIIATSRNLYQHFRDTKTQTQNHPRHSKLVRDYLGIRSNRN